MDYSTLISQAQTFYRALNDNNNKAWWDENRAPYDKALKPGAQGLLAELAPKLAELADTDVSTKLFRPHRDVRFSKDKTPYNTHLHMMWSLRGDGPDMPVFFFGIGLDYVTVGAGCMGFEKPAQENWRKFVDLDTDRVLGITDALIQKGYAFREPALKRVPSPYPKDHRAAQHLRRKGVVASKDIGTPGDLPAAILAAAKDLWPLNALLVQVSEA